VRGVKRLIAGAVALAMVATVLAGAGIVAARAIDSHDRVTWFNGLVSLAVKADAAYDLEVVDPATQPQSWDEFDVLVKEIVYQIDEEGVSDHLITPNYFEFKDFGPGRRSAVAGTYSEAFSTVSLNERFIQPAWGGQSYLSVLIHEIVHAQGYFVGESPQLESQTEIAATEVLAALANLGYPGARAESLDGLRRDALAMAYYIARFEGNPHHTTYGPTDIPSVLTDGDTGLLAAWTDARAAIFTPTEIARSDKRIRWWEERAEEYVGVLARYVVTTATMELDAACGTGFVAEPFQQFSVVTEQHLGFVDGTWTMKDYTTWGPAISVEPLKMDDLAYIVKGLGFCNELL